jgi:uncharacterized membrane protein
MAQHHHPLLRIVIAVVLVSALAALIAYVVVRITNRRAHLQPAVAQAGAPTMHDAALAQLRLRYARGEVSRTDYLQAAADLGAPIQEPVPT